MSNIKILKSAHTASHKEGLIVALIDGKTATTSVDFFKQIAKALKFPDYFGHNLDALSDMLCDFSWLKEHNVDLVFSNYDSLLSKEHANTRYDLLNVLNDAVAEWKAMKGKDKIKFEVHVEPSANIVKELKEAFE
jgi:RNAse (barnase) inhibitor barstar